MSAAENTWPRLEVELRETFRKWKNVSEEQLAVNWPVNAANKRRAMQPGKMTPEERRVTVTFMWRHPERWSLPKRFVTVTAATSETAGENLERLIKAVEMMRMAEVRGVSDLITIMERQIHPQTPKLQVPPPPPPPQERATSSGPYAVLHLADDAPLAIAEAAYRAAIQAAHPDVGGSHDEAKRLNAAIEQIRAKSATGAKR